MKMTFFNKDNLIKESWTYKGIADQIIKHPNELLDAVPEIM